MEKDAQTIHRGYKLWIQPGKLLWNNSVFRRDWNGDGVVNSVTCAGREFKTRGVAAGNAWLQSVERLVTGTMRAMVDEDLKQRRESTSATWKRSSARYDGAMPCRLWKTSNASLDLIHCVICRQCKSHKRGVTWSYLLAI